jgi:hypothetical protein
LSSTNFRKILRLIATLDAEISACIYADKEFRDQWLDAYGRKYSLKTRDRSKRKLQLKRLLRGIKLPVPSNYDELAQYLRSNRMMG